MKISKEEIIHVAELARLDMDDVAVDTFADQIGSILEYVDTLARVDTRGVKPTTHAIFMNNAFREDAEKEHLDRDAALSNAPEKEDGNFIVPRVIG